MHRRPLGSGRRLAFLAGILLVVGSLLPWYTAGGAGDLPATVFNAFSGTGFMSFLAGLGTLALIALPYAMGDHPTSIDSGLAFGLLAVVAIAGVVLWIPTGGVLADPSGLLPNRAYGYWIAVAGAALLGRAAFEIYLERDRR